MALMGLGCLAGLIKQAPAGSRWRAPRLIGTADTALGAGLLLYGLLSPNPWGGLFFLAGFVVGAICVITWVVKAAGRGTRDELGSD